MYRQKYIKYKKKYLNLKINQTQIGGTKYQQILLDGVSSSGKSTVAKLLERQGYLHVNSDDIDTKKLHYAVGQLVDPNEYMTMQQLRTIGEREKTRLMFNIGKNKYVVYDDISQNILQHYTDQNDLFVIVVYASLQILIRNILSRRMYEPRGNSVFRQFSEKYIATNNDGIDIVNRKIFKQQLKKNLKYIFESENDLDIFVDKIFTTMEINDDNNHNIKLRDGNKCDYLLIIDDKTPGQIFNELRPFTED